MSPDGTNPVTPPTGDLYPAAGYDGSVPPGFVDGRLDGLGLGARCGRPVDYSRGCARFYAGLMAAAITAWKGNDRVWVGSGLA